MRAASPSWPGRTGLAATGSSASITAGHWRRVSNTCASACAPEVLPGIGAFYVGGHTLCSQAFTVQTKQGVAVFPGDTIFYYGNLEKRHPVGAAVSIAQCYEAMDRIAKLGGILVPPHDPLLLEKYPDGLVAG